MTQPAPSNVNDLVGLRDLMRRIRDTYNGDPEAAHSMEDALYCRVLHLVVEGHPQAAALAAEALKAEGWNVERWYA